VPNAIQRMLERSRDAVPNQRAIRLPWQQPTIGERVAGTLDALADQATSVGSSADNEGVMTPAASSDSVEPTATVRASERATAAANQLTAALNRLVSLQSSRATRDSDAGKDEAPSDIEIRMGNAAEGPLARATEALARAVAAAGETLYDYSEGHYGLAPLDAGDVRREWKKEREHAKPVTIIEGHYASEKRGSRLPAILVGLAAVAGLAGVAYTQRSRLQPLISQATEFVRQTQQRVTTRMAKTTPQVAAPGLTPLAKQIAPEDAASASSEVSIPPR
jgi:hypothetical protein